jgi:hypothetical protein
MSSVYIYRLIKRECDVARVKSAVGAAVPDIDGSVSQT